jgi:hypothetical protein
LFYSGGYYALTTFAGVFCASGSSRTTVNTSIGFRSAYVAL